jgi:hypothetical protein
MPATNLTKVMTAPLATAVANAQSLAAAGNLTLNGGSVAGGVATFATQRRLAFVSAGNDVARHATLTGTNDDGAVISEIVALASIGTVNSVLDYRTVTRVTVDGAIATTINIGTTATGSTRWVRCNTYLTPFAVNLTTQLSGSVTYQGETTADDFWTATNNPAMNTTPVVNVATAIASGTTAAATPLTSPVTGVRLTVTAGTGTLTAQVIQAGLIN